MDNVNKTLYIPLYGKAYVSSRGLLLEDKQAEKIWEAEGFPLKGKAKSKWLAYTMGMRSAVFDRWTKQQMKTSPDTVILHVGCGMDSRCIRVGTENLPWFDVDFPEVIAERKRYFRETDLCDSGLQWFCVPAECRRSADRECEQVHPTETRSKQSIYG